MVDVMSPYRLVHQALVYESPDAFLDVAVPFLRAGLQEGALVIATVGDDNAARLRAEFSEDEIWRLGETPVDQSAVDEAGAAAGALGAVAAEEVISGSAGAATEVGCRDGSVTFVDRTHWYDAPGRTLAMHHSVADARPRHGHHVRILGEPPWADLDELETTEWARHESVVNVALAAVPARVLCAYDRRTLPEHIVAAAGRTHPELAVPSGTEPSRTFTDPADYYRECDTPLPPPATGAKGLEFDSNLAAVRQFIAEYAPSLGLPRNRFDDFTLAVNEIATNAVRHGGGRGTARLWLTERRVVCEITDSGITNDPFPGYHRGEITAEHGRGLWIARQLCDLLEIRSGKNGTTVRLHVRCQRRR